MISSKAASLLAKESQSLALMCSLAACSCSRVKSAPGSGSAAVLQYDAVDVDVVLHHEPDQVVVEVRDREDHVVALESEECFEVGHLMQFCRLVKQCRRRKRDHYGPARLIQVGQPVASVKFTAVLWPNTGTSKL